MKTIDEIREVAVELEAEADRASENWTTDSTLEWIAATEVRAAIFMSQSVHALMTAEICERLDLLNSRSAAMNGRMARLMQKVENARW